MRFRVLSYNVHKGIGGIDRLYRPERIMAVVEHYAPDIALLQEVDDGVPRSHFHCQVDLFADALGFEHRAYQKNVRLKVGCYGNAILSRFPIDILGSIDLTLPYKKRRQALIAQAHIRWEHHARTIVLANIHLGLAGYERKLQLLRLLDHEYLCRHHRQTPMIIGGDYNDVWGLLGNHSLVPAGFKSAAGQIRTFPAALPMRPLDRFYVRGTLGIAHVFAGHSNLARQASDHLPLIGDFLLVE